MEKLHWRKKLEDAKLYLTSFMNKKNKKAAETRMRSTADGEYTGKE